jgi:hypothetical protein
MGSADSSRETARYVPPPPEVVPSLVETSGSIDGMSDIGHFEANRRKMWSPDLPSFTIVS